MNAIVELHLIKSMQKGDLDLEDGTVRRRTNAYGLIYFESSGNTAKVSYLKLEMKIMLMCLNFFSM
jgi:hypothetical protein